MKIDVVFYIKIHFKNGESRFLSFDRYGRKSLVKNKRSAALFITEKTAEIVSEWFWEKHWDRETFGHRSVEFTISKETK